MTKNHSIAQQLRDVLYAEPDDLITEIELLANAIDADDTSSHIEDERNQYLDYIVGLAKTAGASDATANHPDLAVSFIQASLECDLEIAPVIDAIGVYESKEILEEAVRSLDTLSDAREALGL